MPRNMKGHRQSCGWPSSGLGVVAFRGERLRELQLDKHFHYLSAQDTVPRRGVQAVFF